jgi:hypothetical protein
MPRRPSEDVESTAESEVRYRYRGDSFFVGIPARDLTAADVAALDAAAIETIESSGLYEKVV